MHQRDLESLANEIKRLWGKVSLDKDQNATLFRYAQDLTMPEAKSVLNKMLEDGTDYFTVARFSFFAMAIARERHTSEAIKTKSKLSEERKCQHCQGCGQLIAFRREDRFCCGVAFRCPFCRAASVIGLAPQIVSWLADYEDEFELGLVRQQMLQAEGKTMNDSARGADALKMLEAGGIQ